VIDDEKPDKLLSAMPTPSINSPTPTEGTMRRRAWLALAMTASEMRASTAFSPRHGGSDARKRDCSAEKNAVL